MVKIGKSTIGLADFNVTSTNPYTTGPYEAGENGTIDSVSIYSESVGKNIVLGVYLQDDSQNKKTTLVALCDAKTITTPGWQTAIRTSGSGAIEQGKRYWIATIADSPITYKLDYTEEKWWHNSSGPYPLLRNPFLVGGGSTIYRELSAYFEYTPAIHAPEDTSLQGLINRAAPGSTVKIPYGFYNERVIINKPLKLVGVADRRGRMPILQGGTLLEGWTASTEPEHAGKNVWYKDISIDGVFATWVRSLQLDEKGVQILQSHPLLAGEGVDEAEATRVRELILALDWSEPGFWTSNPAETIDFWQWYDAIACHEKLSESLGRLWLRIKDDVDPNDEIVYVTLTQNARSSDNDDWNYTNDLATVIKVENQADVTIRGLEIRGGRYGIDAANCTELLIEKCKLVVPSMRSINITSCDDVTIRKNEFTSNRMRKNLHPGFGGTSERALAAQFGWDLNKNYSTSGAPSPAGSSIYLNGQTSGVTIQRNWFHGQGAGIHWGYGLDVCAVDAVIENNRFEKMDSGGIAVYPQADGVVRYNVFYDVHLNFRIQLMGGSEVVPGTEVAITNNLIYGYENAGYVLQAHYYTGSTWTKPILFDGNVIQNVSTLIANLLGLADVIMDGNVIDCQATYSTALATHGMTEFTNNWVGGNAENVKNLAWFDANNDYVLDQRLVGLELPEGYEEKGPYRQNVGLPIKRSPKTYAEMTKRG